MKTLRCVTEFFDRLVDQTTDRMVNALLATILGFTLILLVLHSIALMIELSK